VHEIIVHDFAPYQADIAIGRVHYFCPSLFCLAASDCEVWQDVATYGYPQEATAGSVGSLFLKLRAQKGYIQRKIAAGEVFSAPAAVGYELSFLLARGLSGAPIFVHQHPRDRVLGVCTGTIRSEAVEDEIVEVLSDGRKYKEVRLSISQYGLAESIVPLLGWRPVGFDGKTLAELAES